MLHTLTQPAVEEGGVAGDPHFDINNYDHDVIYLISEVNKKIDRHLKRYKDAHPKHILETLWSVMHSVAVFADDKNGAWNFFWQIFSHNNYYAPDARKKLRRAAWKKVFLPDARFHENVPITKLFGQLNKTIDDNLKKHEHVHPKKALEALAHVVMGFIIVAGSKQDMVDARKFFCSMQLEWFCDFGIDIEFRRTAWKRGLEADTKTYEALSAATGSVEALPAQNMSETRESLAEKAGSSYVKYYNLKKNWPKVKLHLQDKELNDILVNEFNKYTCGSWGRTFTHGQYPRDFESVGWDWDHKGRTPAYWKYTNLGACHWLVNFNLKLATLLMPNEPWRIITSDDHSTVWNGHDLLFEFNSLAFGIPASECFDSAFDQELKVGEYLEINLPGEGSSIPRHLRQALAA